MSSRGAAVVQACLQPAVKGKVPLAVGKDVQIRRQSCHPGMDCIYCFVHFFDPTQENHFYLLPFLYKMHQTVD